MPLTPALLAHQARIQALFLELQAIGDSHGPMQGHPETEASRRYAALERAIRKESRAFYAAQGDPRDED